MIANCKCIVKWVETCGSFVLMIFLSEKVAKNVQEPSLLGLDYFKNW